MFTAALSVIIKTISHPNILPIVTLTGRTLKRNNERKWAQRGL